MNDRVHNFLATTGTWYSMISNGKKKFDFRKGNRKIEEGDIIHFIESDRFGNPTGRDCFAKVNLVIHSCNFPTHFGWKGPEFTIFQFELLESD